MALAVKLKTRAEYLAHDQEYDAATYWTDQRTKIIQSIDLIIQGKA